MTIEGHSPALLLLLAASAAIVGLHGYLHARRFWEGMPPLLDACMSAAGFVVIILGFVFGGRIGAMWGHPNAGRVAALALAMIAYRALRTWIAREQARFRGGRVRPGPDRSD